MLFSTFSGPAAFCQRSQCSVPLAVPTKHAEQSGARPAALEEAGPGTEEVCVRPPCCTQLKMLSEILVEGERKKKKRKKTRTKTEVGKKKNTVMETSVDIASSLSHL